MNFNNENEDLIQYYYVNKIALNRPQNSGWLCSTFSSLYVLYGQTLNMFLVLYTIRRFLIFGRKIINIRLKPVLLNVLELMYLEFSEIFGSLLLCKK